MKKSILWITLGVLLVMAVIVALALGQHRPAPDGGAEIGTEQSNGADHAGTAPDFTVLDAQGNEVKLSDFRGRPVVINFWATWCGYCVHEMPDFDKAYREYPDVVFLMINATDGVHETVASAKQFIQEKGYDFDVYFDTDQQAVTFYQISGYPTTFFIDANGNILSKKVGVIDYEGLVKGIGFITKQKQ